MTTTLDLASVCGCSFSLATDRGSVLVSLETPDTTFSRRVALPDTVAREACYQVLAYVLSTAMAMQDDRDRGVLRASFDADAYTCGPLSMRTEFDLVNDNPDHVRVRFTLLPRATESLGWCPVSLTLDLAVDDLHEQALLAGRASPFDLG